MFGWIIARGGATAAFYGVAAIATIALVLAVVIKRAESDATRVVAPDT